MVDIWFISDTHFGHENMYRFTWTAPDGTTQRVRPEFDSAPAADEAMITRWNAAVRPQDHVYHLGDVTMHKAIIDQVMPGLNGHKRLVRGNHDIFQTRVYARWFEEIYASRVLDGLIFTHIPIHPLSMGRFRANIHGHLHQNPSYGPQYMNLCVEHTGYAPVHFDELRSRVAGST